jgi:hypothetical protein
MRKRRSVALLAAFCCCLMLVTVVLAQASAYYKLPWNVLGAGGGTSQSPHYTLSGTLGQQATGISASAHNRLGSGFWYAYGNPPAPPVLSRHIYLPEILGAYP